MAPSASALGCAQASSGCSGLKEASQLHSGMISNEHCASSTYAGKNSSSRNTINRASQCSTCFTPPVRWFHPHVPGPPTFLHQPDQWYGSPEDAWLVFYGTPAFTPDVITWTRLTGAYNQKGMRPEALNVYRYMQLEGIKGDVVSYLPVLDAISGMGCLNDGKRVHADIREAGVQGKLVLSNSLINMYGKCGSAEDAMEVFEGLEDRDVISWTSAFTACSECGDPNGALQLFHGMQLEGVRANRIAFIGALNACSSPEALEEGRKIHGCVLENGCEMHQSVANSIVSMYGKCGDTRAAVEHFERMPERDVISWTALLAAYVERGLIAEAFRTFQGMQLEGVKPNRVTFVTLFNACGTPAFLVAARRIHGLALDEGFDADSMVANSAMNMYGKCGCLEDARSVFDRMSGRDAISWNALISAYAHRINDREPLVLFEQMEAENVSPTKSTFVTVLYACARLKALDEGRAVHARVSEAGLANDVVAGTAIVNMYAKCGCLDEARGIFEKIKREDVISWNAMIGAYAEQGLFLEVMELLKRMEGEGMSPDEVTYMGILKGCNSPESCETGRNIHGMIVKRRMDSSLLLRTALLDMYVKCGSLEDAEDVFDGMNTNDIVSWTVMIDAYAQDREYVGRALLLFRRMQLNGVKPDRIILSIVFAACALIPAQTFAAGKVIHAAIAGSAMERDLEVENALLQMYGRCRCIHEAREIFEAMKVRDKESWSQMLAAHTSEGQHDEVLKLFDDVQAEVDADTILRSKVVLTSVATACGNMNAYATGARVHGLVEKAGLQEDVVMGTALIAMYGRLGSLEAARRVFDGAAENRDLMLWTAMIAAYAHNGSWQEALEEYPRLQQEGFQPDEVLFVALLSACSWAGLAEQAIDLFVAMGEDYGIQANQQHFGCLIDLLGRSGRLVEAEVLMETMPDMLDAMSWMSMLSGCKIHSDMERSKRLVGTALTSYPDIGAAYVIVSDMHRTQCTHQP